MFATFRKYQKVIYIAAMAVVIPSFVVYFSPYQNMDGGQPKGDFGAIDGKPISREEYEQAQREVALRYRLFMGQWPDSAQMARFNQNLQQETFSRVVLVRRLGEMNIQVGDTAVAEQIRNYFRSPQGEYDPANYANSIKMIGDEKGISEQDFIRFVRHQVGIQHLADVHGLSGKLVAPRAAEDVYRRENEQLLTAGVFFYASNFVSKVEVKTNDLAQFYTNQLGRYRIPVRVQVHYVAFEAINYLTEAAKQLAQNTNLNVALEADYQRRGTNSFTNTVGKVLSPEEAKEQIKEEARKAIALNVARREATKLAQTLYDMEKKTAADFMALAATNKLTVKVTAPFTIADGPSEFKAPTDFARSAFALSETEPVGVRPVVGEDAVYLFALKERLREVNQPLETVKDKVTEDYRKQESVNLMHKAAQEAYRALTNATTAGKSFVDAAKAAKLEPVVFQPLAKSERKSDEVEKHVNYFMFQNRAWDVPPGKTGEPMLAGDTGFIVHVIARNPAPADKMAGELPKLLEELRETYQGSVVNDWLNRQSQGVQVPAGAEK